MKEGAMMSRASVKFEEIKEKLLQEEEFKYEYEKLKPRYEVISQLIEVRSEKNITQEELAKMVGTQKSNISRLESGTYNPSLDFLIKVAKCLGKEVKITLLQFKSNAIGNATVHYGDLKTLEFEGFNSYKIWHKLF